jgi:hypothetical protein
MSSAIRKGIVIAVQGFPAEVLGNSRVVVGRIKVDELDDAIGIYPSEVGQFIVRKGVPGQNDALNF